MLMERVTVCVLDDGVVVWSSVYSMFLSFVVHKNRKIKELEGVGSAWRHTDACVTSCLNASCFLTTVHQGIQAILKHRQLRQRYVFLGQLDAFCQGSIRSVMRSFLSQLFFCFFFKYYIV